MNAWEKGGKIGILVTRFRINTIQRCDRRGRVDIMNATLPAVTRLNTTILWLVASRRIKSKQGKAAPDFGV